MLNNWSVHITCWIADLIWCDLYKSTVVPPGYVPFQFSIAKCDKFVIDLVEELLIVYERFYEIYGDILAARNSFNIKAYEMGEPEVTSHA